MSQWKIEQEKTESKRRNCEKEALDSLRRGDTTSAKHYAEKADKIKGNVKNEVKVAMPRGAWKVKIVPNTPKSKKK